MGSHLESLKFRSRRPQRLNFQDATPVAEVEADGVYPPVEHSNYDGGPPAEGTTHAYAVSLNTTTGNWTALFDSAAWDSYENVGWKKTGSWGVWQVEIYNKEDDLAGTNSNRCTYSNCSYKLQGGSWTDAGFVDADMFSKDANEWGVNRTSGTAFDVWDKDPISY